VSMQTGIQHNSALIPLLSVHRNTAPKRTDAPNAPTLGAVPELPHRTGKVRCGKSKHRTENPLPHRTDIKAHKATK